MRDVFDFRRCGLLRVFRNMGEILLQIGNFISEDEKIKWQIHEITAGLEKKKWAIYGTGEGTAVIYAALTEMNLIDNVKYIIDPYSDHRFYNTHKVMMLEDVVDDVDVIFIAAKIHHRTIYKRVVSFLQKRGLLDSIQTIDVIAYNCDEAKIRYVDYLENEIKKENSGIFVRLNPNGFKRMQNDAKIIAWYLPQFHQIEVNNRYLGQGFTEWTNTSRMVPLFIGHEQPHIPYDVGYYDLMNIETFQRQILLAKHYGIYGFAFHYYWFSGKRVMEKSLNLFLKHEELHMPFCLSWATENWTTLWDGGNRDVIYTQSMDGSEVQNFFKDILPFLQDTRYIKINGRPVFIVYRATVFPQEIFCQFIYTLRRLAQAAGFPDLYVMLGSFQFDGNNVTEWFGDALVEYQPHTIQKYIEYVRPSGYLNPYFSGRIIDISKFLERKEYLQKYVSKKVFRAALTSWDNSARKYSTNGAIFLGHNPATYKTWLQDIMNESRQKHSFEENIVFVNSWNEWAEGSHLEPDLRHGYAYLEATRQAIEETRLNER